jgi:nicotinic acid mononucleotide adenylyltransferase
MANMVGQYMISRLAHLEKYKGKKIAFYGGSFFPMHPGHLEIAETALKNYVDLVVFCPHSHNPDKSAVELGLKNNIELIQIYIQQSKYPDQLFISDPEKFLHGIQNTSFLQVTEDLKKNKITSYVIIGGDSLKPDYPAYLRKLPHIIAPRMGYPKDFKNILRGEVYILDLSIRTRRRSSSQVRDLILHGVENLDSIALPDLLSEDYKIIPKKDTIESQTIILGLQKNETLESRNEWYRAAYRGGDTSISHSCRVALSKLAFLYSADGDDSLAEECILNSAAKTDDPELLMNAAAFYIFKKDPELDTGMAYLTMAARLRPDTLYRCDLLLDLFLARREFYYPKSILERYFEKWEELRKKDFRN